ncbi:MAG: hypothetical protein WDK96_02095 [Candidatus Paceibacterota bacterium]|jgi:hypothetical protein
MKNIKSLVALFLLVGLFVPAIMFAEDQVGASTKMIGFCSKITTKEKTFEDNTLSKEQKSLNRKESQNIIWDAKKTLTESKKDKTRAFVDEKRELNFSNVEVRAKTDAQKQAVETYKTTIKTAIENRRTIIDSAINNWRTTVEKNTLARRASVNTIWTTFKTTVDSALLKAKTDCATGTKQDIIKTTFNETVRVAREKMETDRKALFNVSAQVESLNQIKRDIIKKAQDDFKAVVEKAKADLKIAFPNKK